MTRPWSSWLPEVLPHARGCPSAVAIGEIRNAARAFFEGSRAWNVRTDLQPVVAGQALVALVLDAGIEPVRIREVWIDGREVDPLLAQQLDEQLGDRWMSATGAVSHFIAEGPGRLRLYRVPDAPATEGLRARLSVMPTETAEGIPDELAARWRDAITAGARARVLSYAKAPWGDVQLAGVYGAAFQSLIDRAVVHVNVRGEGNARRAPRLQWY
jgi:hypothetical protein